MTAVDTAQLVAGAVAALVLLDSARGWFRRTIGRRRDSYRRLHRLGTGARLQFFESVLGEPPAISRRHEIEVERWDPQQDAASPRMEAFYEHFFIKPDHYVHVVTDADDTVACFSITARSTGFRPTFTAPNRMALADRIRNWRRWRVWPRPLLKVQLNKTRFAGAPQLASSSDDDDETYVRVYAWMGARAYAYAEAHDFGNPGHYQTFVLSTTSCSPAEHLDSEALSHVAGLMGYDDARFDDGSASASELGRRFRQRSVITTYTVLDEMALPNYAKHFSFGPHGDEVRTLP